MTEGAEKSLEELLEEAAVVTEAAQAPKAKKPRTPKMDASGNPVAPKEPRALKEVKQYQQAAKDGTAAVDGGGQPVMGPYATRYKEPKAPKEPRATRLDADGNPVVRGSNVFADDQVINKVDGAGAGYRDGSKRKQNFDLIANGGITVADYYAAGGGKSAVHTFLVWYLNVDQSVSIE